METREWSYIFLLLMVTGCADTHPQTAEWTRDANRAQAEQNRLVLESTQSLAEGSQQLIEAETESRQALVALQQDLRADQAELQGQHTVLEVERKSLSTERKRDSFLAAALTATAVLLACLTPVVLAGFALFQSRSPSEAANGQTEVLIQLLQAGPVTPCLDASPAAPPSLTHAPTSPK